MQNLTPQAEQIAARVEPLVAGLLAALMRGFGHAASMAQQGSGASAMRHYLQVPPAKRKAFERACQEMEEAETAIQGGYGATKQQVVQFLAPLRQEGAGGLAATLAEATPRNWDCHAMLREKSRLRSCVQKLHLQADAYAVAVEHALGCVAIAAECAAEDACCEAEDWPAQPPAAPGQQVVVGNAILGSAARADIRRPRELTAEACGQLGARLRQPVAERVAQAARDAVQERSEGLWLAYQASASAAKGRQAEKAGAPADRPAIAALTSALAARLGERMAERAGAAVDRAYGDAAACRRMVQAALEQASGGGQATQAAAARALEAFALHAALPMAEEIAAAAAEAVAALPQEIGPGPAANLGPETISQVFHGGLVEELVRSLRTTLHAAAVVAVVERAPELCAGLAAQAAKASGGAGGGAAVAR